MTTVCSSSAVDNETNLLSIFNILEEVNINLNSINNQPIDLAQKKAINFPFEIISVWGRLNEVNDINAEIKIILHDPDGIVMQELPYKLEIKSAHQRMRIRIKANGLTITKQGNYYFSIFIKEKDSFEEVAKVPLVVKMALPTDLSLLKK